jgi:ribonuclease VapC
MVIDSSALLAIVQKEPERELFLHAILTAPSRMLSSVSLYETSVVLLCRDRSGLLLSEFRSLLEAIDVTVVGFEADHVAEAVDCYRTYGKGLHPAGLNLGDCVSYALAKSRNEPLLFKGGDFSKAGVKAAV